MALQTDKINLINRDFSTLNFQKMIFVIKNKINQKMFVRYTNLPLDHSDEMVEYVHLRCKKSLKKSNMCIKIHDKAYYTYK